MIKNTDSAEKQKPFVSVIIPCREEEAHIAKCLDSIIANYYDKDRLEIIVIDGMSRDRTRVILENYVKKYKFVKVLDNPKKEPPSALNVGIVNARGEIIIRMDAHSFYKSNYISECLKALEDYGADIVGARRVIVPRDNNLIGKAICFAGSSVFGVGNAYYRLIDLKDGSSYLKNPRWNIHAAYLCCRKEIFDKVGLFNENLYRSEDVDFIVRFKKAGYRSLFVPSIICYYSIRTSYPKFLMHMFRNGFWVFLTLNYTNEVVFSFRHVVPMLFVSGMIAAIFLVPAFFIAMIAAYSLLSIYYSFRIAVREKDLRLFFVMPFIFASLHISYGVGSMAGLPYLIFYKICSLFKKRQAKCL